MVNFYIPSIYHLFKLNISFFDYMRQNETKFHICKIKSVYGTLPGMIWDGGRLIEQYKLKEDEWKNVIDEYNRRGISVRFACTNSMLEEKHFYDYYCNDILSYADNGLNEIIVNSSLFENYLRSKFKTYKYISSTTKCITNSEKLEIELNKGYDLVVPDLNFNNSDNLFSVKHPEKCEILLNDSCGKECVNRKQDYNSVSLRNIGKTPNFNTDCPFVCFKQMSLFDLINKNPACVNVEDLYSKYVSHGFKNFKIVGRGKSPYYCLEAYIYYMVKEEFRWEVLSYFLSKF